MAKTTTKKPPAKKKAEPKPAPEEIPSGTKVDLGFCWDCNGIVRFLLDPGQMVKDMDNTFRCVKCTGKRWVKEATEKAQQKAADLEDELTDAIARESQTEMDI